MLLESPGDTSLASPAFVSPEGSWGVGSETGRLTDALLALPTHLRLIPVNSVSQESLCRGLECCTVEAQGQHRALVNALKSHGVTCHVVPAALDMPDLVFARDAALMTPWGLVPLNPSHPHRARETGPVVALARSRGVPILPGMMGGTIEGGDVCIVRPGLVVIGWSGERTSEAGAVALARFFEHRGWRAMLYRFDPHFLHLDTQFCMLDANRALACVDVLDEEFLGILAQSGIELIPISYKEARGLGCNIVSLGDGRILSAAGQRSVNSRVRALGYEVTEVEIDQFTRCGGGVHCLILPLARNHD